MRIAWLQRGAEHSLNRYEEMTSALQSAFHEQYVAWVPYLFVYIGYGIQQVPPEQERALLTFLKHMEHYLIEHGAIQAVGFRYVGHV